MRYVLVLRDTLPELLGEVRSSATRLALRDVFLGFAKFLRADFRFDPCNRSCYELGLMKSKLAPV